MPPGVRAAFFSDREPREWNSPSRLRPQAREQLCVPRVDDASSNLEDTMNNRLVVSLIAASLMIPGAAFAQSTTVEGAANGARVGGDVAGPVGAVVGGTVGAAVGLGLEIPNAVITSIDAGTRAVGRRARARRGRRAVAGGSRAAAGSALHRISLCGGQRPAGHRRSADPQGHQDHRLIANIEEQGPRCTRRREAIPCVQCTLMSGSVSACRVSHPSTAAIAKPAQAASASTTKSSSRACRPGAQSCRISSTPIMTTAMTAVSHALARIGETERKPDQDERQRVFTVLTEIGMRPELRRAERCKGDGGGEQPGEQAEQGDHGGRIARFTNRMTLTSTSDSRVVNGGDWSMTDEGDRDAPRDPALQWPAARPVPS